MLSPLTLHRSSLLLLIFESDANQRVRRAGELGTRPGGGVALILFKLRRVCVQSLSLILSWCASCVSAPRTDAWLETWIKGCRGVLLCSPKKV